MKKLKVFILIALGLEAGIAFAQPEFKGGQKALNTFIANNLIYLEYSKLNCLQGTVMVNFRVNGKGEIINSRVGQGFGTDLDGEALRIVRLTSGKWIVPADHDTSIALLFPINFSLTEFNCEQKSKEEITASIAAYKARESLTQGILNYYDRKEKASKPDANREREIEALKLRLGYDEKFINSMLRQAQQKVKQGDKEGACEDLHFIRKLGSNKADKLLMQQCGYQ